MKRTLMVILVVALLVIPGTALANGIMPIGERLTVFVPNASAAGGWEPIVPTGDGSELARAWKSGEAGGYCNEFEWEVGFTVNASIAQWIDWDLGGTKWDWQIRKPGTYAADCISFQIASNGDVDITFDGFADVLNSEHGSTIPTYFGYGGNIPPANWVRAVDLNETTVHLPYEQIKLGADGTTRYSTKLWNRLDVDAWTQSSNYTGGGTVYISVTDEKPWIDGDAGRFPSTLD